ncbi:MAG: histidine--tRNA ligase, partial [Sphingomonas sp.]
RHTAFEFVTDRLGAQCTVLAGGRYDGLVGSLGGPETPGVGWAAGIERLAMLLEEPVVEGPDVAIAVEDDAALATAFRALKLFRENGLSAEMVATGSPRKRFDKAAKLGAKVVVGLRLDGDAPVFSTRAATDAPEHETVKTLTQRLVGA